MEQKTFAQPAGGLKDVSSSLPLRIRSEPGLMRAWADAALPVRRWQCLQWQ
jgi:hypothetical protein